MNHDDVVEGGRVDTAAIRRAEAEVPFVGQQPDAGEARQVGGDQRSGTVAAAVVDHQNLVDELERSERAGDVLERVENILEPHSTREQ